MNTSQLTTLSLDMRAKSAGVLILQVLLLLGGVTASFSAEQGPPEAEQKFDDSEALVLSLGEDATGDRDGNGFKKLTAGEVLTLGAVIRSGNAGAMDLFLRRWGTTVRLMPDTELALDKMSRREGILVPAMRTHLDLRQGRIFCFIRIPVPESEFQVKTKAGRTILNSAGAGRYDIRADGTIVAGNGSFRQLQFVTERGVVTIEPGQKFVPEKGQLVPAAPSDVEILMIQMDQLTALAEKLSAEKSAGVASK